MFYVITKRIRQPHFIDRDAVISSCNEHGHSRFRLAFNECDDPVSETVVTFKCAWVRSRYIPLHIFYESQFY